MNIVVGPYTHHHSSLPPVQSSMSTALETVDACLSAITQTGIPALNAATSVLSTNLTHLIGTPVTVAHERQTFWLIIGPAASAFKMTGTLIESPFQTSHDTDYPGYQIALEHQLIQTGDELIDAIYDRF